jgi:hypothetical protein
LSYIGSTPANKLVTSSDMEDGIVSTDKLAANAVTTAKITDGTIAEADIANDAVTADKIANAVNSAISANTSKTTNATHSGEVTGSGALTIADNIVDEANLKVSNSPTNGYGLVARSGNTGGMTWEALGGGKLLQVVSGSFSTEKDMNSASYVDTDITLNITPSATSSKIMVIATINADYYRNRNDFQNGYLNLLRGSTSIKYNVLQIGLHSNTTNGYVYVPFDGAMSVLDSPSSTSQLTYKVQAKVSNTSYNTNMRVNGNAGVSTITLMEISA